MALALILINRVQLLVMEIHGVLVVLVMAVLEEMEEEIMDMVEMTMAQMSFSKWVQEGVV